MRRTDKEITKKEEMEAIIAKATICRIGFIDTDAPYIVPMNFGYQNNCLYFHSAHQGRKIDILKKNNNVCFEIDSNHEVINTGIPCNWSSKYASVMGTGKASILTDDDQKKEGLSIIIDHYSSGSSYSFSKKKLDEVVIMKIEIVQMTGKKSI